MIKLKRPVFLFINLKAKQFKAPNNTVPSNKSKNEKKIVPPKI